MGRNDKNGDAPSAQEWQNIQSALQLSRQMANRTANALHTIEQSQIGMRVVPPNDPRLQKSGTSLQSTVLSLLTTHYKLGQTNALEINGLRLAYAKIHQRLMKLGQQSFRIVSHEVASAEQASGGGDVFGYVRADKPDKIFLNETYFGQPQSKSTSSSFTAPTSQNRGQVVLDPGAMRITHTREYRASILLHETVHMIWGSAGAVHRAINAGENVDTATVNCDSGYPQIRNYNAAFGDAYVVARFARCVNLAQQAVVR